MKKFFKLEEALKRFFMKRNFGGNRIRETVLHESVLAWKVSKVGN